MRRVSPRTSGFPFALAVANVVKLSASSRSVYLVGLEDGPLAFSIRLGVGVETFVCNRQLAAFDFRFYCGPYKLRSLLISNELVYLLQRVCREADQSGRHIQGWATSNHRRMVKRYRNSGQRYSR